MVWWEASVSVGDEATCEVSSAAAGVRAFIVHRQAGRQPPPNKAWPLGRERTLMTDGEGLVQAGPGRGQEGLRRQGSVTAELQKVEARQSPHLSVQCLHPATRQTSHVS